MKLITFHDDKVIKQLFENVSNVVFDGSNLSFTSNSTPYSFTGFQQYYSEIDDSSTLIVGDSATDDDILTFLKAQKHIELLNDYENALLLDITSSLIGSDGKNIIFGYSENDQKNFNKIGTLFALNPNLDSHIVGTHSHGAININRSDFIQFINDCDQHESDLYNKFDSLRTQVENAADAQSVELITW